VYPDKFSPHPYPAIKLGQGSNWLIIIIHIRTAARVLKHLLDFLRKYLCIEGEVGPLLRTN
jgi:hypothetical protein